MPSPAGDTASILSQNTTSSNNGRSIYPRGPTFSLDTFASKDFIVKDFVESLSDGATQANRRSGSSPPAFDPKPYIRTFEHALTRLSVLSDERETHENELAGAVRRAEVSHREHCATLQSKLDQSLESFNKLENRLDSSIDASATNGRTSESGGHVALQIGERLEEFDRQKRRAEDAKFILQCWQDITERGSLSNLEDIRRLGGGEGKVRCAQVARQLLNISNRLDPYTQINGASGFKTLNGDHDGNGKTRLSNSGQRRNETNEALERFLERLETDLLSQFDECKRQHNDNGMRECAAALYDFGEGASVIAHFVNQHQFFLERSHMITEEVAVGDTVDRPADPDTDPMGVDPGLQSLVDEVKLVLEEESYTIKQVFPFYELVLITFLQRIFQQSIQQRLEQVLAKVNSISSLAFLRSLQAAKSYMGAMVEDIKSHGLTEHPDAVSPQVSAILDQQVEDLFVPYLIGSSYIERERRSLEELYASLLFKFTLYHSKREKMPTTYLGSLGQRGKKLLASARDTYMERLDSSELPPSQKALLIRIAGIRNVDIKNRSEIEVTEVDGTLSLVVAKRMLKWLAEAVGRGLELSGGNDTPKDVAVLFNLLLTNIGDIYLDTALASANDTAALQENSKPEPDLSFIPSLRTAVSILQLVMTVTNSVLLPLAASNVTVHREMEKSINVMISRVEDKIGTVQTRIVDVALNWASKLLARQNRNDFRPRDDVDGTEQLQTSTCSSIFTFLTKVREISSKTVEGKNLEPFFTELAMGFRTLLLDHFKKFQVNLAGGLMVSKDITKYIELLRTFHLPPSFLPSLEVLVELGNIFVIGPEALKDRLRGGSALTGIDKADLRPYILRRDDANSVGVQSVLNAL